MARIGIFVAGVCMLGLAGCITAPDTPPPAWFEEADAARTSSYPELRDVPRGHSANVDDAYWARYQAELEAARAAMKANPRAAWAPVEEDPDVFMAQARATLEATRASHE